MYINIKNTYNKYKKSALFYSIYYGIVTGLIAGLFHLAVR
tara:strand:- start:162 stop:281 length:120 start_codon:yes stop_codon:yes gene_type:complete